MAPFEVIGVGIDLVEIARFRALLARRPALALRCFSEAERASLARRRDPVPALAARFAAKEATMKALGVGLGAFALAEVEVLSAPTGAPCLQLSGRAARLAAQRGATAFPLSLTHSEQSASALVLAQGAAAEQGSERGDR